MMWSFCRLRFQLREVCSLTGYSALKCGNCEKSGKRDEQREFSVLTMLLSSELITGNSLYPPILMSQVLPVATADSTADDTSSSLT